MSTNPQELTDFRMLELFLQEDRKVRAQHLATKHQYTSPPPGGSLEKKWHASTKKALVAFQSKYEEHEASKTKRNPGYTLSDINKSLDKNLPIFKNLVTQIKTQEKIYESNIKDLEAISKTILTEYSKFLVPFTMFALSGFILALTLLILLPDTALALAPLIIMGYCCFSVLCVLNFVLWPSASVLKNVYKSLDNEYKLQEQLTAINDEQLTTAINEATCLSTDECLGFAESAKKIKDAKELGDELSVNLILYRQYAVSFFNPKRMFESADQSEKRKIVNNEFNRVCT
ncbi:MAG: hypothetical protein Q8R83_11185 [Legionellaceae bacterium]|nr:hypothetical protein [Legionellaceae bacterium]